MIDHVAYYSPIFSHYFSCVNSFCSFFFFVKIYVVESYTSSLDDTCWIH